MLIAKEAPVATDLRKINVAYSGEIERMGDLAVKCSKVSVHIGKERHIEKLLIS